MRVYIAGLISKGGTLSEEQIIENLHKFEIAEELLKASGFEVYSPIWHSPHRANKDYTPSTTLKAWADFMKADIKELMDCDFIFPLSGWEESPGAVIEVALAERLGIHTLQLETPILTRK